MEIYLGIFGAGGGVHFYVFTFLHVSKQFEHIYDFVFFDGYKIN